MLQTSLILALQIFMSMSVVQAQAASSTLRESAAARRQMRLELHTDLLTTQDSKRDVILRRTQRLRTRNQTQDSKSNALQRRTQRVRTATATQSQKTTAGVELLLTRINQERTKNSLPTLVMHSDLRQIAQNRLGLSGRESSRQTLQSDLDSISLFDRTNECNCIGTSNEFRFLSFMVANENTGFTRFINRYNDVFLNENYQFIGIAQSGTQFNVLLGGYAKIAVTEFSNVQITEYRADVLALVNKERSKYNLKPLTINVDLQTTAQTYAKRMWDEGFYGHVSPKGDSVEERLNETNYFAVDSVHCKCHSMSFAVGENIAKGQKNPEEVMTDWMNSPGHRENILSKEFKEIGIGLYGNRWVQNFGAIIYE